MEGVYKELDKVKSEMEKLESEYLIKTELSESLRKAHNEQLVKIQEAKCEIEKQAQELNAKSEEIAEAKKIYEDLKYSLHEKESFLKHLSFANEQLRADCGEKMEKLEGENRELVLALDEATVRNKDLERKICAADEEIEGLKRLLSVSQKKCFEAEQEAQAPKELRQRDDMILKLEEENRSVQDELKWKKEQFTHLEDAHKGLQDQFWSSKEEWEREKSALLQAISSLQTSLDSQTRISEGLHTQLRMCNQALAHEESRRKLLEVQVSESSSRFGNVFAECREAKSEIETSTVQRDKEISKLRNSLGTKETLSKEMEFRIFHLEQENQELQGSLKELREAQINNAGAASLLSKLRNKLRSLEQVHSNCSTILKGRESEWSSEMGKMKGDMNCCIDELKDRDKQIQELQMELEGCQSSLEVHNEEISVILMVLKSEFSVAYSKLSNAKAETELCNKEMEERISLLTGQLEMKNNALHKAHVDLEQEHEEVALLMKKVESLDLMKQQKILMAEELERHKKMLEESSGCQILLNEQVLQMENALKEGRRDVSDALEKVNSKFAQKIREGSQVELELQKWRSTAESLKVCLEENQEIHRQMEFSLLAQVEAEQTLKGEKESLLCLVEEQEKRIGNLQQQINLLETTIAAKTEAAEAFTREKENYLRIAEEKDSTMDNLQKEIAWLKQESMGRELEGAILVQLVAEKTFEQEKERLLEVIKEKDQCIEDLRVLAMSLEQDFTTTVISSFSDVTEKQVEIDVLSEAFEKAEYLKMLEIQEKNKIIAELEKEGNDTRQKLEFEEESLFHSKRQAEQLEALLEANKLELEKLRDQFGTKQRSLEDLVKELEFEKGVMLEDIMKLSSEREDLLVQIEGFCDRISEFSCEDVKLMENLGKIFQSSDEINGSSMDSTVTDVFYDSTIKNANTPLSPRMKKVKESIDKRSPLKELNR